MSSYQKLPVFGLGPESTWDDLEDGLSASADYQSATHGQIIPLMCFAPTMEPADPDAWKPLPGPFEELLIVSIARSWDELLLKSCRQARAQLGEVKLAGSFPAVKFEDGAPLAEVYRQMREAGTAAFALLGAGADAPSFFFFRGVAAIMAFSRELSKLTRKLKTSAAHSSRPREAASRPVPKGDQRGPSPEELKKQMPPEEQAIRRKVGVALMEFMQWIAQTPVADKIEPGERERKMEHDVPMLEHRHEQLRQVVEEAAAIGIETALTWHTLGVWSNDGPERIRFFTRALERVESGRDRELMAANPRTDWGEMHMRADCLYEIGRVYANEGEPEKARGLLERALPLAQETERLRGPAGITHEDGLEGRIAALLMQLPEPGGDRDSAAAV